MDTRFAILALLAAKEGNRLVGRTLLQKKVYFLNESLDFGFRFTPYYYGPYSAEVANALDSLVALGFIKEERETFAKIADDPFGDQKRYTYELTDDGKEALKVFGAQEDPGADKEIQNCVEKMDEHAQANDYHNLSIAAKIHHIVKTKRRVTVKELKKEAKSLGWKLDDTLVNSSVEFLEKMGFVKTKKLTPKR